MEKFENKLKTKWEKGTMKRIEYEKDKFVLFCNFPPSKYIIDAIFSQFNWYRIVWYTCSMYMSTEKFSFHCFECSRYNPDKHLLILHIVFSQPPKTSQTGVFIANANFCFA